MAEHAEVAEPYVFLSYTTPDRARVLALADTLVVRHRDSGGFEAPLLSVAALGITPNRGVTDY